MTRQSTISSTWTLDTDYVEDWAFINGLFTPEECQKIIEYGKTYQLDRGTVFRDGESVQSQDQYRNSEVAFISPEKEIEWVYMRLAGAAKTLNEQFFKFDLFSFGENLQFTQYSAPGEKYDYHVDRIYNGPIRKLSLVLQLTDPSEYDGGDLEINVGGVDGRKLPRDRGTVVAFPSYVLHRVTPVTRGVRNSLVGWINGKPFK